MYSQLCNFGEIFLEKNMGFILAIHIKAKKIMNKI